MSTQGEKGNKHVELRKFTNYINQFRVTGEGVFHTHTIFAKPGGKLNVPDDKNDEFIDLYSDCLGASNLHIVERPKTIGPFLLDIDFNTSINKRQYTNTHIEGIIKIANEVICELYEGDEIMTRSFVMEKQTPTKKNSEFKDGFHILYPYLAASQNMRYLITHEIKVRCINNKILNNIKYTNSIDKIFDMSVIKSNGWMMYGSRKLDSQIYKLTGIYDMNCKKIYTAGDEKQLYRHKNLVKILSNRKFGIDDESKFNEDMDQDELNKKIKNILRQYGVTQTEKINHDNIINKNKPKKMVDVEETDEDEDEDEDNNETESNDSPNDVDTESIDSPEDEDESNDEPPVQQKSKQKDKKKDNKKDNKKEKKKSKKNDNDDKIAELLRQKITEDLDKKHKEIKVKEIDLAIKLVNIINKKRAGEYDSWSEISWALHNINAKSLYDTFISFSKKSKNKYNKADCDKFWTKARSTGYGISRLKYYARIDNPEAYTKILRENISGLLEDASIGAEDDIGRILYELYGDIYKCVNIGREDWYEFQGNKWVSTEAGYTLFCRISTDLNAEFAHLASYFMQQCSTSNTHQNDSFRGKADRILKLMKKLKTTAFRSSIMKDCARKFYDPLFEGLLDSNPDLLGFDNGVFDLMNMKFRPGKPDDLISMSTGYNYKEYSMDHEHIIGIKKYFSQIMREEEMQLYVLTLLASFLDGYIRSESFAIWTGCGCLAAGQQIKMSDGTLKNVEDIKVNDKLLGQNNEERTVLELFTGYGAMYSVEQDDHITYITNQAHRLNLKFVGETEVLTNNEVVWYELDEKTMIKKCSQKFENTMSANNFVVVNGINNINLINENHTIICTVSSYLKLNKEVQTLLKGHNINGDMYDIYVKYIGDDTFYGFELDDKTFVLSDGTLTCNSNGKSKTVELLQMALGDYATILPVTVLTQKKGSSSAPNSEIAQLRGIRFAVLQEPEGKDEIQLGSMKEMTGGDYLYARKLFGNPFKFKPQFKLLLTCNKLPTIDGNDNGTWRRIRVTPFESEFTDNPILPHQFMRDRELIKKLNKWNKAFMWLLLHEYYPIYRGEFHDYKISEPEKVTKYTKNYQKQSDIFLDFIESNLQLTKNNKHFEQIDMLYAAMKQWYSDSYTGKCPYTKNNFVEYLTNNNFKIDKTYLYQYAFRIDEGPTMDDN